MYLTEAEAREEDCPFFRDGLRTDPNGVVPVLYVHRRCAASACKMAWRWEAIPTYHDPEMASEAYRRRKGYCGIAGKPEG